jgi:carbon-monoxide dehydrogenase medium subunit
MLIPHGCTYVRPADLDEAVAVLVDESARPVSGGIALTLLLRYGFAEPGPLVDLSRLTDQLGGLSEDADGSLRIGALTTLREIETSPVVARHSPMLSAAASWLASVRIRNIATIGGHLAHADPHQDLPPVLLALGAEVEGTGPDGDFKRPLDDVLSGYYETTLGPGEIITAVRVPASPAGSVGRYRKFTARTVEDWPAVGVAVRTSLVAGSVATAAIAVGAVTVRAERRPHAEELLIGQPPSAELLLEVAAQAAADLQYSSDQFGTAGYKQRIVCVNTRRALEEALTA